MSETKIIAVVGATGAQGGGLCDAIVRDPNGGLSCRAITRDPGKDKARALAARGAAVVTADLDDVESLKKAFAGAYGAYCVTNFWEHFSAEKEKAQAGNLAAAVHAAGVKHVIWSTLEDTRRLMAPDDHGCRCSSRNTVSRILTRRPRPMRISPRPGDLSGDVVLLGQPVCFGLAPKKGADGVYGWMLPMGEKRLAGIAAEDIGQIAYGIFKAGRPMWASASGLPQNISRSSRWGHNCRKCSASVRSAIARSRRRVSCAGLSRRGRNGQHVSGLSRFRTGNHQRPRYRGNASSPSGAVDLRTVPGEIQGSDSAVALACFAEAPTAPASRASRSRSETRKGLGT